MTDSQLWKEFLRERGVADCGYDAWAFGAEPDALAELVARGEKTATSSAYALYAVEQEPLPEAGGYDIILNGKGDAVCVIRTDRVYVTTFDAVTAEHAFREGEGDKSLAYWRRVHEAFFRQCLAEAGLTFDRQMQVVCEEFSVVYLP